VSVIIPAYNAAATLADQLLALQQQTYTGDWEIILADNGSTDDTGRVAREWQARLPELRLISATDGRGAAYARNTAVGEAAGDLLAFCDADDVVDARWIEALVHAAPSADALGGRLEFHRLNDRDVAYWRHGEIPTDRLMTNLAFLPFALSANLAVWRDAFVDAGGFPHYEGAAGEDVAFCWRLQLAGHTLVHVSDAVVHHRYRPDLRGLMSQYYDYGMAQARLYREFREHGARRRSFLALAKTWIRLAWDAPRAIWDGPERGRWLRRIAYEAGHLRGALRYRVLFAG
jgi:glycosyltransferase involved in cell wall biosynthesis